jgi:uncharacterized integral membrane protein
VQWLRRIVVAALFVGTLVVGWRFAHANPNPLVVDYLLGTIDAPLWAVLLGSFGAGAIVAAALVGFHSLRLALTARRYRKLVRQLEDEVHQLRNLPLAPPARAGSGGAALEARARSG